MQFKTIADVYTANDEIRRNFVNIVSELTEEQAGIPTENGKWTLGKVIEHVAKVDGGTTQLCYKLLSKAQADGKTSDGSVSLSKNFVEGITKLQTENQKLEAPEIVQPEGGKAISESLESMKQSRAKLNEMKAMFEGVDGTVNTFPHPYFGDMSAQDWLVLIGGHEARHLAQIKRILAQD